VLLVANEFLDALPVRQLVMTDAGWREVMVAADETGRFVPWPASRPMDAAGARAGGERPMSHGVRDSPPLRAIVAESPGGLARRRRRRCSSTMAHAAPRAGSTLLDGPRAPHRSIRSPDPGEADPDAARRFANARRVVAASGRRALVGTVPRAAGCAALGIVGACRGAPPRRPRSARGR
jgi:NADH dehydrogenase [ubiquinone] 1 alpha subcomplex assembly factor 7